MFMIALVADDILMYSNFITPEEVPWQIPKQPRNCRVVLVTPEDTSNPVREGNDLASMVFMFKMF